MALTQTITGTGTSDEAKVGGHFNVDLTGFGVAVVELQRKYKNESTWFSVQSFTADGSYADYEHEQGTSYRFNTTSHTSGTITARIGN